MAADELFADRYRLERRIGVGGMATVQLAFDSRLERYVAVKLLAEHLAEDASFVSRFRREALAAARLVHPNIVQVFDFGLDEATARNYIVMEFVDGQSCAEILRDRGSLAPSRAVEILTQACRGLDYAHRNGVVHRDVKPGNLLRGHDAGLVKLADFGIAKAAEQSDITKVGSVLGTAAYLSPEQARGEPAGPSSDLYALGVVAYQLLSGRLPYEAASLTDLARQQGTPPPRLDEVNPEVPRSLASVVAKALNADPERRYADASAMEAGLRDGLEGRGPQDDTDTTWAVPDDETAATQMLSGTSTTRALPRERERERPPRRRLEPIAEPAPPPSAPPARRREPARRGRTAPPAGRGGSIRMWVALLAVLAVVAAGIVLYQGMQDTGRQAVQLRENVEGKVQDAIEELRGLVDDNTR